LDVLSSGRVELGMGEAALRTGLIGAPETIRKNVRPCG